MDCRKLYIRWLISWWLVGFGRPVVCVCLRLCMFSVIRRFVGGPANVSIFVLFERYSCVQNSATPSHHHWPAYISICYSAARLLFTGKPSGVKWCSLPCQSGSLAEQYTRTGGVMLKTLVYHYFSRLYIGIKRVHFR